MKQVDSGLSTLWGKNPDWDTVIMSMDTNRDGVIDYDEFMVAAADREKLLNTTNLKNAFKALDKNGNGKIEAEEIKEAFAHANIDKLSSHGFDINDKYWEKLIADLDENKDGEISYEEFESHMLKIVDQAKQSTPSTPR